MTDLDFEVPQYAVIGQPDEKGKIFLGLQVSTKGTMHLFYLCKAEDFRKTADGIRDGILKAGQDATRQNLGLVVAKGPIPNGLVPKRQGGK